MEWILISIVVAAADGGGIPFLGATGRGLVAPTTILVLAGVTAPVSPATILGRTVR